MTVGDEIAHLRLAFSELLPTAPLETQAEILRRAVIQLAGGDTLRPAGTVINNAGLSRASTPTPRYEHGGEVPPWPTLKTRVRERMTGLDLSVVALARALSVSGNTLQGCLGPKGHTPSPALLTHSCVW